MSEKLLVLKTDFVEFNPNGGVLSQKGGEGDFLGIGEKAWIRKEDKLVEILFTAKQGTYHYFAFTGETSQFVDDTKEKVSKEETKEVETNTEEATEAPSETDQEEQTTETEEETNEEESEEEKENE